MIKLDFATTKCAAVGEAGTRSGWTRLSTAVAILLTAGGFALTLVVAPGSHILLALFVLAAIAIDFGVQGNVLLAATRPVRTALY